MAPPDLNKLATSFSASFDAPTEDLTLIVGTDGKHGTFSSVNKHSAQYLGYGLDVYGNLSNALPAGGAAAMSMFLPIHPGHLVANLRFALDWHESGGVSAYCALRSALLQLLA